MDLPSERRQRRLREPEKAANTSEHDNEPHRVDRRARVRVHALPPARSGQRVVAREREHDARRVDALRRARHVLHDDDEAPDREHPALAQHVQEQLAHRERERRPEQVGHGRGREGGGDVQQPAKRCGCADSDEDGDGRGARGVGGLLRYVRSGVVWYESMRENEWERRVRRGSQPVRVHMGDVNASRNAQPPACSSVSNCTRKR